MNMDEAIRMLTQSESKVFPFLLTGKTTSEISREINMNERMIHFHSSNIFKKLNATSRIDLMSKFIISKKAKEDFMMQTLIELKTVVINMNNSMLPGGWK